MSSQGLSKLGMGRSLIEGSVIAGEIFLAPLFALPKALYLAGKVVQAAPCFNNRAFNEAKVEGFTGETAADVRQALLWDTAYAVFELFPLLGVALRMSNDTMTFWKNRDQGKYTTTQNRSLSCIFLGESAQHNLALLEKIRQIALRIPN